MGKSLLILGRSGSGKSTSLCTIETKDLKMVGLSPRETFLIKVIDKELPYPPSDDAYVHVTEKDGGKTGNLLITRESSQMCKWIENINKNRPDIKTIVFDDYQYGMSFKFMEKYNEKGYEKFNEIGNDGFAPLAKALDAKKFRNDLMIIFLMHSEESELLGKLVVKPKTIGKMLDDKISLEGLFTTVLHSTTVFKKGKTPEYKFKTKPEGEMDVTKSPIGLFEEMYIPNDLGYVREQFIKYYKNMSK